MNSWLIGLARDHLLLLTIVVVSTNKYGKNDIELKLV